MKKLRTELASPIGLVFAVVLYFALNTIFNLWPQSARLDVTKEKLYTLSTGTKLTLANIDEPITLSYFFSRRLGREVPFYRSYARRVRDLLVELESASNGKVILQEHNPEPFTHAEDLAVSQGVQGIPLDQGDDLAYFGLSGVNSVDENRIIPFFQAEREHLLEYDLVEIISGLSNVEPVVVGVMSSLPILGDITAQMQGKPSKPWAIGKRLRANFSVINLPQRIDDLPENIDIMMVVHPQALNARALYEIEQFIFRGGRALFFIDPKSESDFSAGPELESTSAAGLQLLFDQWGVQVPEDKLVADRSLALRVNAGTAEQPLPAEYLVWLNVPASNMQQDDPITSQLAILNLATTGSIELQENSELTLHPLVFSSTNSGLVPIESVRGLKPDIMGLLDNFQPDNKTYVLAGRLTGKLNTAFPNGAPTRANPKSQEEHQTSPDAAPLRHSNSSVNLVLIADSDMLENRFWIRTQQFFGREVEDEFARNADFIVNIISNLAGSDELLTLRSRGTSQRPFEKVIELSANAETRLQEKESELQDKLKETQQKIAEFEGTANSAKRPDGDGSTIRPALNRDQRSEVESLRGELLSIRKELRGVQVDLRREVKSLERQLQFFNIGFMPLIVVIVGLAVGKAFTIRRQRGLQYAR